MRKIFQAVAITALVVSAGCGGGAATSPPTPMPSVANGQGGTPSLDQSLSFVLNVPSQSAPPSARKKPENVYVSPATASVSLQLVAVNGTSLALQPAAVVANVPASCTNGCAVSITGVKGATGTDRFTIKTFAGRDGGGATISQGVFDVPVTPGTTLQSLNDPTKLSIGGIIASIAVSIEPNSFQQGTPSTAKVIVTAKDPGGAVIVGPVQFANPIVIKPLSAAVRFTGNGSVAGEGSLSQPETSTNPLTLAYDGSVLQATITASTLATDGTTITAQAVNLAIHPAPTPSPPPYDLYVLNGMDNTISEYDLSTIAHQPGVVQTPLPRREFGGTRVGCAPVLSQPFGWDDLTPGVGGITADSSGNIYVGSGLCRGSNVSAIYKFDPAAVGSSAASEVASVQSLGGPVSPLYYDPLSGNIAIFGLGVAAISEYALSGSTASNVAQYGCFVNPQSSPQTCQYPNQGFFGTYAATQDAAGNFIVAANDPSLVGFVNNVVIAPPQAPSQYATIENAWINFSSSSVVGNNSGPVALVTEGSTLYVYTGGPTNGYPGNTGLAAFDLSQLSGQSGPVPLNPKFFLTGDTVGRFTGMGALDAVAASNQENQVVVHNGLLYVANSFDCNVATNNWGLPCYSNMPANGEIDVYDVSALTGTHNNDVAPVEIISGSGINTPVGIVLAPRGTGMGSTGLTPAVRRFGTAGTRVRHSIKHRRP